MFDLPIFKVGWELSMEDKVGDRESYAAYNNLLLLIFS